MIRYETVFWTGLVSLILFAGGCTRTDREDLAKQQVQKEREELERRQKELEWRIKQLEQDQKISAAKSPQTNGGGLPTDEELKRSLRDHYDFQRHQEQMKVFDDFQKAVQSFPK